MGSGILSGEYAVNPFEVSKANAAPVALLDQMPQGPIMPTPEPAPRPSDFQLAQQYSQYEPSRQTMAQEPSQQAMQSILAPPDQTRMNGLLGSPELAQARGNHRDMSTSIYEPSDYQTPAFSNEPAKIDAYGMAPFAGLQKPEQTFPIAPAMAQATTPQNPLQGASPKAASPLPLQNIGAIAPQRQEPQGLMGRLVTPKNIGRVGGALGGSMVAGPMGSVIGGLLGGELMDGMNGGGLLSGFGRQDYQGDLTFGRNADAAMYGRAGTAFRDNQGGLRVSQGGGVSDRTNRYGVTERTLADGTTVVTDNPNGGLLSAFARDMSNAFSRDRDNKSKRSRS